MAARLGVHVVSYPNRNQERYRLPVHRGVRVRSVRRENPDGQGFVVDTSDGGWRADAVISVTGTWERAAVLAELPRRR